jgi:predicted metal-dependent enzyme (double-stranded beta helix superfamily)
MREAFARPEEVAAAFDNTITRATSADELMLYRGDDLTVFRVALDPQFVSIPHNHGIWAFVGIYQDKESNTFYERSHGNGLKVLPVELLCAGDVLSMNPDVIHSIANPLSSTTIGLHVYLGNLGRQNRSLWNPTTHAEEPFDLQRFLEYEKVIQP